MSSTTNNEADIGEGQRAKAVVDVLSNRLCRRTDSGPCTPQDSDRNDVVILVRQTMSLRRIFKSGGSLMSAQGINVVTQFLLPPIFLHRYPQHLAKAL